VEGRQYPVKTVYLTEPTQDWVESALKIIFQIHYKEPLPGDILVFLTGQDTIEGLEKLVNDYAEGMDKEVPKLLTLPLFAALPQHAQQLIFQPTPYRTRKVILATNIAETSVTVPGVRYVIDCGKSKIKQFRNRLGLESLLVKPISKSAAIQRQGRAGREAAGRCYRLYTLDGFKTMDERTTPEILRCDLSQALLTMKARGVNDVLNFPFLDRPPREALEKALLQLLHLQALADDGTITETGLNIAKFPLTPTLGRVLVEAAKPERDCLLDVIDIISALSVENVFLNIVTEERKEEAEEARRELYRREGDHLTLLVTVQQYAEEQTDRKQWCEKHFVSHRAMQNVMNIRKQLQQQCVQLKLLSGSDEHESSAPSEARSQAILQCMLRGFISNTARLMPDGSYKTLMGNQTVAIHPSSVLFGRKVEAIVFNEFLFTSKAWARGVSTVQLDWVSEVVDAIM
jgi:ATP-dependent RNA helicase DHR2